MQSLQQFLDQYGKTHTNGTNKVIHLFCVPLIAMATIGIFWPLNMNLIAGTEGALGYYLNASIIGLFVIFAFFYSRMGTKAFVGALLFYAVSVAVVIGIDVSPLPLLWTALAIWVAAWVAQLIGHQVEGAKPSFLDDLVFLLVGPLFVLEEFGYPVRNGTANAVAGR